MPYKSKGKCIYKKDTGKKVGCTKGSVKKYMKALHANVQEDNFPSFKDFFYINENNNEYIYFEPNDIEEYIMLIDNYISESLYEISNGVNKQSWSLLSFERVNKIWKLYGEKGIIRDIKGLVMIIERLIKNSAKIHANNVITGHSDYGVDEDILEEYGFESSDDLWDKVGDYFEDDDGVNRISDYGIAPIEKIIQTMFSDKSPESLLIKCDKILNIVHQRSDLSSWFIKGGADSLDIISENKHSQIYEQFFNEQERTSFYLDNEDDGESFSSYYDQPIDDADTHNVPKHKVGHVTWLYDEGRGLRAYPEYTSPRSDNIFDMKKIKAVATEIKQTEDVIFDAPIAQISVIDEDLIRETQEASKRDALQEEYFIDYPFTTGDEELDLFLVDEEEWFDEYAYSGFNMDQYVKDPELVKRELDDEIIDEGEYNDITNSLELYQEVQERLVEAKENKKGDFGQYWITLRDGNHRAFGAFASGEPYIIVNVIEDMGLNEVDKRDLM